LIILFYIIFVSRLLRDGELNVKVYHAIVI